jgi:hypothetical protein
MVAGKVHYLVERMADRMAKHLEKMISELSVLKKVVWMVEKLALSTAVYWENGLVA